VQHVDAAQLLEVTGDESQKEFLRHANECEQNGPVYARSRKQDYLEPNGGTLAPMRFKNRARK
jgi:hypothetical protein